MRPNKIMSIACVPPACVNKSSAEMGAVLWLLLLKKLIPEVKMSGFLQIIFLKPHWVLPLHCTDGETEAERVAWWTWNQVFIFYILTYEYSQLRARGPQQDWPESPGSLLWPVGRPLAGSSVCLTADLKPSFSGGSHRQVGLTHIAVCGYFLPLLLYKPRTLSGHLQTFFPTFF